MTIAELVYRALLKVHHLPKTVSAEHKAGTIDLINRCFWPAVPMIRGPHGWVEPTFTGNYEHGGLEGVIASLPAAKYVVRDGKDAGKIKVDPLRLGLLRSKPDLSSCGYEPIHPLRGVDFNERFREFLEV